MKQFLLIDDDKTWNEVLKISYNDDPKEISFPDTEFHIATGFKDGIEQLKKGNWDAVYIDHNLGCGSHKTGIEILEFLKANQNLIPKEVFTCTNHAGNWSIMYKMIENLRT